MYINIERTKPPVTYFKRVILPGILFGLVMVLLLAGAIHYGFLPENMQRDIYEKHGLGPRPEGLESPSPKAPEALPKADTARLEQGLSSRAKKEQAATLVPDLRDGNWKPEEALPSGAKLTIQPNTFRKTKHGDYVVTAQVTGSRTASFTLHLQQEDGKWLIYSTERAGEKKSAPSPNEAKSGVSHVVPAAFSRPLAKESSACTATRGKTPVLLVHGFNSNEGMWGLPGSSGTMRAVVNELDEVQVSTFDYSNSHFTWVSDQEIGPALAERISCLYAKSSKKVVLIAHSMGGLAARYALSQPGVADKVGLMQTIATPHLGTRLANVGRDVLQTILCTPTTGSIGTCLPEFAVRGLARDSRQLTELSHFPAQIPIRAIAGDVTAEVQYLYATIYANLETDKVVGVDSATAEFTQTGRGDGKVVFACLSSHPFPIGSASCEHNGLPNNPKVQASIKRGLEQYLATLVPTRTLHGLSIPMQKGWVVTKSDARTTIIRDVNRCNTTLDSSMEEFREQIQEEKLWCAGIAITDLSKPATEGTDGYYCESTAVEEQRKVDGILATYRLQAHCQNGIVVGKSAVRSWHMPAKKIVIDVYDLPGNPLSTAGEAIARSRWVTAS